ncbi:MAG TPA: rhodanese-like domain-containing protein [Ignavibacteria bacterium]|nr:rhodanese-like domain-containing protein [Ignavibacteria bacterium]HQY53347.1 rhodanese-like domain-containing protein [Ignavibacteria bacterium]HRB01575.1 rhodanese-like domain-containing protein [Ignavibacteria bacterium]
MQHKDIDTKSFKELSENDAYVLLDVRTPDEFNSERLKDSINIDFYESDFEDKLDELDKRKKYLIYCRSGNRSRQAMFLMRDLGFEEVNNLSEGIISWVENNFETIK